MSASGVLPKPPDVAGQNAKYYCVMKNVRRWPYKKLHKVDHKPIGAFFDTDPFFSRNWDVYHIEDEGGSNYILVPFTQVKNLVELVQEETGISIPLKGKGLIFDIHFCEPNKPALLGQSNSRESYDALVSSISANAITGDSIPMSEEQREKQKLDRKAKAADKRGKKFERWTQQLQDVGEWLDNAESNKYFVSIDVESYERNHNIITEVGISTLIPSDTNKLNHEEGISTRHVRVSEYRHYRNGDFVNDNADRFHFGTSEFISIHDVPKTIAQSFRVDNKSVVFVGHDTKTDIEYLRKIGYDVNNLKDLTIIDTVDMWRGFSQDMNAISLGRLCTELEIDCYDLHNAGNDAHYTLMSLLGLAKRASEKHKQVQNGGVDSTETEKLENLSLNEVNQNS